MILLDPNRHGPPIPGPDGVYLRPSDRDGGCPGYAIMRINL